MLFLDPHKHCDMIIAKANNKGLTKLYKNYEGEWVVCSNQECIFLEKYEYFVCLEENTKACLHWLNGDDVEIASKRGEVNVYKDYKVNERKWYCDSVFYTGMFDIRIKKKTKIEYVQCDFNSVGECVQQVHDHQGEYFFLDGWLGEYCVAEYQDSAWYWKNHNIYRKTEVEV